MNPEIKLSKLKPIDYEEIINVTNNYRIKSEQSTEKLNNILKKSKQSKDKSRNIEHKKIWNLESIRLNNKKRKLERKINSFINSKVSLANGDSFIADLFQFQENVMNDHSEFKSNIIEPVWILCEDIKEWKLKKSRGYRVPDGEPIRELITSMLVKLNEVYTELEFEEQSLTNELQSETDQYSVVINSDNIHEKVGTGIPMEAWNIECFEKPVLAEMLSQFLFLDTQFQEKLDQLEVECDFIDNKSLPDEWSEEEVQLYDHLQDIYFIHGTVNRNLLLQDILRLVFQKHSKKEMMEIEKFIHSRRLMKEKRQSLVADWRHDRAELFVKIKASIIDYNERIAIAQVESQKMKIQKDICSQLTEQVNDWREKKEQLRDLEESLNREMEERRQFEDGERMRKELEMRNKTKKMIFQYQFERNLQSEKALREKQRRIDELKDYLQKQAMVDEERVAYRENLRREKLKEELAKKEQLVEQQYLSEMKLNKLIEQVRPLVESDPERIMKPTRTWLNHTEDLNEKSESEYSTMPTDIKLAHRYAQPLNTYNDKELLANPRFRVENALREAGLINSDYARNILKSIPSNQAPRKDCNLSDLNFLKHE